MNKIGLRALALSSLLVLALASSALAASSIDTNPFTSGSTGADVSWPNCSATYPTSAAFGIVGVTGGRAFTANSCFSTEWAWANSTGLPALYLNLNAPVGSTSSYGMAGPKTCKRNDKLCLSYNYGWQAAQWAYQQAKSAGASASTWWLDVETGNSWSSSTAANDQVIQGAVDYLGAGTVTAGQGLTVGVYSTNAMYAKIAGAFHPTNGTGSPHYVPTWYATAATTSGAASGYCAASYGFTGGPVWLVQYLPPNSVDADYAC